MKEKQILTCLNDVNERYITEATPTKKQIRKYTVAKWCAIAASLVLLFTFGVQSLLSKFYMPSYTVTLDGGNEITFFSSDTPVSNLDIALVGMRALTSIESDMIFGAYDVDAYVGFNEITNEFIYLEGTLNEMKIIVRSSDLYPDIVLDGKEHFSTIQNIPVSTGYFLTETNSQGNQTAIVHASFKVGNYTIQLEDSGPKSECSNLCTSLAQTIDTMIQTCSFDFEQIQP